MQTLLGILQFSYKIAIGSVLKLLFTRGYGTGVNAITTIYLSTDNDSLHLQHILINITLFKKSIIMFWVVKPCSLGGGYELFRGTYCLHLRGLNLTPRKVVSSDRLPILYLRFSARWRSHLLFFVMWPESANDILYAHAYADTNSTRFWAIRSKSRGQETSCLLWNQKVQYRDKCASRSKIHFEKPIVANVAKKCPAS